MAEDMKKCAHCAHNPEANVNTDSEVDGVLAESNRERTKERTDKEFRALMNRLKRIEGQIRGIEGMLEKGAYCPDILVQVSSVNSALNSFNKELLASHIRGCVAEDIRQGDDETIEELVRTLQKLMK